MQDEQPPRRGALGPMLAILGILFAVVGVLAVVVYVVSDGSATVMYDLGMAISVLGFLGLLLILAIAGVWWGVRRARRQRS